jgi:choline dehydrogenase-like flavoprotein
MKDQVIEYDVVIIGSGAGGGTVAKELADLCEKGFKVALLESGGEFKKTDNTREEVPMASRYYVDNGGVQTSSQDMTLAFAEAVGGSTTVYTGTSLEMEKHVIDKWNVEGITEEDLRPRYVKYRKENNVHLNPPEEINENNRLFFEACQNLGWKVDQFPVNTKNCQGLGTCNLGCAVHAKQGTNVVQIPMALSKGVKLITHCEVDRIDGHEVIARVKQKDHWNQLEVGVYRFKAKKIIVSAGAINSPAILMRSGFNHQALGRYFTCHPALIIAAEHENEIDNIEGHPKSYYCDEFLASKKFLLETCIYFPFTLSKSLCGFGKNVDEMIGNFHHLQMILALISDEPKDYNRVAIDDNGKPMVHYRFDEQNITSFVESIKASAKIFFASGAKRVHAPGMKDFFIYPEQIDQIDELIHEKYFKLGKVSISAAHLMGGCRMGTDQSNSVTNPWGKVHGTDHIYVADASLFPFASEVNPYLTIMAVSDRVAEGVKKELL